MQTTVFDARTGGGLKINQYGNQLSGIISVPDNYATGAPAGGWPVLIFFHGAGEASTARDITALYKQGIPKLINAKMWNRGYVVLAIQAQWATPECSVAAYVLENKIFKEYNVSRNKVFTTGLSFGGGESLAMAIRYPNLVAAVVSASPSSLSTDAEPGGGPVEQARLNEVAKNGIPVSFWVGMLDGGYVERVNTYYNTLQAAGGEVYKFNKANVGHSGWDSLYNGVDKVAEGLDMYAWLDQFTKGVEEPDEEEPEEDPEEPTAPKLLVTIQVFDDGTTKQTKNA
jgi:pimeloyl-ACP methyl ester carboxylesterase